MGTRLTFVSRLSTTFGFLPKKLRKKTFFAKDATVVLNRCWLLSDLCPIRRSFGETPWKPVDSINFPRFLSAFRGD